MTERYSQTVDIKITKSARIKQFTAIAFLLLSLGFIMLAAFVSLYYLIAFGVFFIIGAVILQLFNNTPKQFVYDFSTERLIIYKKNAVNRQKRVLSVLFSDVTEYGIFADLCEPGDIAACENTSEKGVMYVNFTLEGANKRLLFVPDEYMRALLDSVLKPK